ncbi:MAG: type II toxin-antitoxin system RelE/ParE family toxin [Candidatus Thiodiazotropha sp. (ex Ustalcina ferruginea)]|nr:type II toxin-antitoxin system RelE/ParE family toxin [Candidatus Thiodiazotropha sp. (ex Ustalcina ferruginea)]
MLIFLITGFKDRETGKIREGYFSHKLPCDIQSVVLRKLHILNNAHSLDDRHNPPANRLEALSGNRKDQHSFRINDQ